MATDDAFGWNLRMVRASEALEMMRGGGDAIDWGEVEIAHIDTGYTEHQVFGPWMDGRNGILQVDRGVNYMEPGNRPYDPLDYDGFPGHGTRTCSVLCASLPGTLMGVAPGVPVAPYRATNTVIVGSKRICQNIAQAITNAVDSGCEVISISLGFPRLGLFGGRPLGRAVDYAYENGAIVVAAAGQAIDRVCYPGKFFRSICVGGVRPDATVWFEYDRGMVDFIDVWAPSDKIDRANTVLRGGDPVEGPYKRGDGTSYATVHVAAAAAVPGRADGGGL